MKRISEKQAIKIALQYMQTRNYDDAKHVLEFYKDLYLDNDIVMAKDESGAQEYICLGFDFVENIKE